MTDTPQDAPPDDPSSAADDASAKATVGGESLQDKAEETGTGESKKPWWKFWG